METCSGRGARIVWNTVVARSRPRLRWALYCTARVIFHRAQFGRKLGFPVGLCQLFFPCGVFFLSVVSILHVRSPNYSTVEFVACLRRYLGSHCCLYSVCMACPLSIVNLWVLFGNSWYVAVRMLIQHWEFLTQKDCFCFWFSVMYTLWSSNGK